MNLAKLGNVNEVNNEFRKGKIIAGIIGLTILSFTLYSFLLSTRVNRLLLKQLKDNGYS